MTRAKSPEKKRGAACVNKQRRPHKPPEGQELCAKGSKISELIAQPASEERTLQRKQIVGDTRPLSQAALRYWNSAGRGRGPTGWSMIGSEPDSDLASARMTVGCQAQL
jgi:hypothetical protein